MKKLAWLIIASSMVLHAQTSPQNGNSYVAGRFVAYNYGLWSSSIYSLSATTGAMTITLRQQFATLPDGRKIMPYNTNAPLLIGTETLTPSAVSGCTINDERPNVCTVTVTATKTHAVTEQVSSGTFGLQEALNDASLLGGGAVSVDQSWSSAGGTTTMVNSAVTPVNTGIEDIRTGPTGSGTVKGQATGVIPLPTAANVIGAQSHLDDGVTKVGIVTSSEPVQALQLGGVRYASQYQTPPSTGNNGIANAASSNALVIADPSYASTEQPSSSSFSVSPFHYQDLRIGQQVDFYHNPQYGVHAVFGDASGAGHIQNCLFDKIPTATFSDFIDAGCFSLTHAAQIPGWSLGNPVTGGISGSAQGWQIDNSVVITHNSNSAGITQSLNATQHKYGVGDNIPAYLYAYGHGGFTAASDEGTKALGLNTFEDQRTYTGTLTSGSGTGSTLIKTTPTNDSGSQGSGQYIIDTTQSPITGTFSSITTGLVGSTVTVSSTVAVSNAWGTLASDVGTPLNTVSPFSTSETFNVSVLSGAFDTTHLVCMAGQYHDCAFPSAVGTPSGGVQSVTIPLRRAHASGSYIFQGGMAGYGLEAISFTESPNGQPLRYLFDVVGSTTANTLQVVEWQQGVAKSIAIPATTTQSFNIATGLSSSGTTVAGSTTGGTLFHPYGYNLATFIISGSSDSALNTYCTNFSWSTATAFTCTIAGLSGTHTSSTTSTASLGTNGFNLWPMAETLDVQNETLAPPIVDGTLQLEPNVIVFANNDVIEQPHHVSMLFQSTTEGMAVFNPFQGVGGYANHTISASGTSVQGGGSSTTSNSFLNLFNGTSDSFYLGSGGYTIPTNWVNFRGPFEYGVTTDHGPTAAFINIGFNAAQLADVNYCFPLVQMINNSGTSSWSDCTNSGNMTVTVGGSGTFTLNTGGGGATYNAGSHTFQNGVTINGGLTSTSNNTLSGSNIIGGASTTTTAAGLWNFTGSSINTMAAGLLLGNATQTGTTTPITMDTGGTYGTNTAGTSGNCKVFLLNTASNKYCIGASASNLEYQIPTGGTHTFYVNGAASEQISATGVQVKKLTTTTACASSASPAICSAAPSGFVAVAAGGTTLVVDTTAVTASSQISLTFDSSLGTALSVTCNTSINQPTVSARTAGTSFTITMSGSITTNPDCISYTITN